MTHHNNFDRVTIKDVLAKLPPGSQEPGHDHDDLTCSDQLWLTQAAAVHTVQLWVATS